MKNNFLKISVMLLFGFCLTEIQGQNTKEFTNLKGDYLGQTPSGMTAEIFAPGIVSVNGRYEYGV